MIKYIEVEENGKITRLSENEIIGFTPIKLDDDFDVMKIFDYKYYDGKLVELTSEEKEEFYPIESVDLEPSEQDIINATLMKEIALLKVGALNE